MLILRRKESVELDDDDAIDTARRSSLDPFFDTEIEQRNKSGKSGINAKTGFKIVLDIAQVR